LLSASGGRLYGRIKRILKTGKEKDSRMKKVLVIGFVAFLIVANSVNVMLVAQVPDAKKASKGTTKNPPAAKDDGGSSTDPNVKAGTSDPEANELEGKDRVFAPKQRGEVFQHGRLLELRAYESKVLALKRELLALQEAKARHVDVNYPGELKVVTVFYLKHIAAKQASSILNEFFGDAKDYRIVADERTNSIVVQCPQSGIKRITNVLEKLDAKGPVGPRESRLTTLPVVPIAKDPTIPGRIPEVSILPARKLPSFSIQTSTAGVGTLLEWAETYGEAVSEVDIQEKIVERFKRLADENAVSTGELAEEEGRFKAAIRKVNLLKQILLATIEATEAELIFTVEQRETLKQNHDVSVSEMAQIRKEELRLSLRLKVLKEILDVSK
jgi:hypothetical protein